MRAHHMGWMINCKNVANPCDVGKKHVYTYCDDLLSKPCSLKLDACSTSMQCDINIVEENNELKSDVKNLSTKLEVLLLQSYTRANVEEPKKLW
jgi:hypothetical protein